MACRLYLLTAMLVFTGALGACNKRSDAPAKPPAGQAPAAEAPPPSKLPTNEDPAAVQAIVDRWLEAQNQQDFAAYEKLYASRFEGVRRSGPRVVRLDRKGWVADRERMFRKPMKVEISDVRIEPFATGAVVAFTQRWASGKYEDVGPKQLVVVRDGGELRIAREEMLASEIVNNRAKETALARPEFAFVIHVAGGQYVVLEQAEVTPKRLELISKDDPVTVMGALEDGDVSPEVASWLGQTVDSGGCTGKITKLVAISRSFPHFSVRQEWEGTFEAEGGQPYTEEQIAESAFKMTRPLITGKLETSGCTAGWFVRKEGLERAPEGKLVTSAAIEKAAVRAFRELPAYKSIQKEFGELVEGASGPWEESAEGGKPPLVQAFQHPTSGQTIVAVHASAGVGCGQFGGSLSVLFRMTGNPDKPKLELLGTAHFDEVHQAVDIDGDGSLELIVHEPVEVTSVIGSDGLPSVSIEIPYLDCGC